MSLQEIITELTKLSREELAQVDFKLHELLGEKRRTGEPSWGQALLEVAGTVGDRGKPEAKRPSFREPPPWRGTSARASSASPRSTLGLGFAAANGHLLRYESEKRNDPPTAEGMAAGSDWRRLNRLQIVVRTGCGDLTRRPAKRCNPSSCHGRIGNSYPSGAAMRRPDDAQSPVTPNWRARS